MNKNTKTFLISCLASMPFWLGVNFLQAGMENFLYEREFVKHPPVFLTAQLVLPAKVAGEESQIPAFGPQIKICANPDIMAQTVLSVEFNVKTGKESTVFKKNENQQLPIASLTKLMTALVVLKFYKPEQGIKVSRAALAQPQDIGNLREGEMLTVQDLLKIMLIESSNDAAFALSEFIGEPLFVDLMNLQAEELGLTNSGFINATGLDGEGGFPAVNYSSVRDLQKLTRRLIEEPEILQIISQKEYPLYLPNGELHHILKSTNQLLGEVSGLIGGKTGWTEKAGGCLMVILATENPDVYIINVILNSPDRFSEMKKLIACISP